MRTCPECNKKYDDATTFCLEDGAVLNPAEDTGAETVASSQDDLPATQFVPPPTQAAIPATQMFQGEGKKKGKKSKEKNFTNPPPLPKIPAASQRPPQNNSALPIAIIGLVLLVALVGGWFWYSSTAKVNTPAANTNRTPDIKKQEELAKLYSNASPGANPPNLLGAPNATVTVEEFADFQCGTCAVKHPVAKEIIATYGSRIKFIFRNFPLTTIHDKSYDAATAAEAAGLQGKFWEMQNQLFTNQSSWSTKDPMAFRGVLEEYAQKIGLNIEKFKTDMAGLAAKSRVDLDMQRGKSLRLGSTPSFFVNGKPISLEQMTAEGFKQLIDAELQKPPQQ